ncbi:fungal-specific transcription factor domain-containing protein [Helicostylum pulchrum]|uniref:Zn(2)-C6 fungal-type domain-containing protein n=1 Tax=Helicostylum pulchrum TaxID=562976 RepID=A0ABP9XWM9_9FUNG|nr:fungal-specific transcription factor domain-containing protein [Helicostylum pulchrum]
MEGGGLFSLRNKTLGVSKRIKISRACDECRKRKVKCDGVQPCGRCKKSNAECVFAKLPPKRGPPKQYMENLENRLQRVEKALKSVTAPVRKVFEDAMNERKSIMPEVSPFNKRSVSYSAPYTSDLKIERFTINEIGQAVYVNDLKSRVDRIPKEYHNDTQSDVSDSPISSATASFFHTPPSIITTYVSSELPIPEHLSSRHIISEVQPLTEVYFDHVHKYVPMIHKPSFLKQMHSTTNPPSRFLLYAMCAVASRWSPDCISSTKNNGTPAGFIYFQRALELLDDFIDSPRVTTIQGLILLVKYQEYFQRTGYFHRSYFYLGMAVRMCFDLGISQSDSDSESKRRTFWVTFMYDLLMSIEQGHTTHFQVQKCKAGFPLVTGEEGPALEELVTNQNIFIQLGKVLSEIYVMSRSITKRQELQGDKRSREQTIEEQARLFSLHTHLENFLYEVPPTLIYPPTQDTENYPAEKQVIGDPFIGFLHMTYHFSVILLHRTYTSLSPPKTEYNFITYPHRKLCATSASNITTIAETLYEMYPTYTFSYPTRGVQHTIHCLATASTIHKYEMMHGEDETTRESAKQQYMLTLNIMQQLSNQSPSIEVSNYFNQPTPMVEKRMSAPIYHNVSLEKSRIHHNNSSLDEPVLYQSSATMTDPNHLANLLVQQQQQQHQQQQQQQHQQQQQRQHQHHQQQQQQHQQHQQQQNYATSRFNTYPQMSVNHHQQQQQQQQWTEDLYAQQLQMTNSWNQSPMFYNQHITNTTQYPEIMIPSQQEKHRTRRHTVSFATQDTSYLQPNVVIQEQFKKPSYHPNQLNTMLTNTTSTDEDAIMMDTPLHYDPTPGMSQLFLTDDQHNLSWNGSIVSETSGIQRSEGHVMK